MTPRGRFSTGQLCPACSSYSCGPRRSCFSASLRAAGVRLVDLHRGPQPEERVRHGKDAAVAGRAVRGDCGVRITCSPAACSDGLGGAGAIPCDPGETTQP